MMSRKPKLRDLDKHELELDRRAERLPARWAWMAVVYSYIPERVGVVKSDWAWVKSFEVIGLPDEPGPSFQP